MINFFWLWPLGALLVSSHILLTCAHHCGSFFFFLFEYFFIFMVKVLFSALVQGSAISPRDQDVGTCRGPASAGSRGYPQDERRWWEREKTRETRFDRAKSARKRERGRERETDRQTDRQTDRPDGGAGRVWQCFIFYHSFYTPS